MSPPTLLSPRATGNKILLDELAQRFQTGGIDGSQEAAEGGVVRQVVPTEQSHKRGGEGRQAIAVGRQGRLPADRVADQECDEVDDLVGAHPSAGQMDLLAESGEDPLVCEVARHDGQLGEPGGERRDILGRGVEIDRQGGSHGQGGLLEVGDDGESPKGSLLTRCPAYPRRPARCASRGPANLIDFQQQATLPTYERGTRGAETVVAVMDGASWLQELIDEQCPHAVRIPGTRAGVFPHAVGYLSKAAQAVFGVGSREAAVWLDEWAPKLKTEQPEVVLAAIRALPATRGEAASAKRTALRYLNQRLEQIRYVAFQAQGYPIGSGIVESGGKLVVATRLDGSGMQWEERNLNPMLALRGRLCSGQWEQIWPGIWWEWRTQVRHTQRERRAVRQAQRAAERAGHSSALSPVPKRERQKTIIDGRPTAAHPWKQPPAASAA